MRPPAAGWLLVLTMASVAAGQQQPVRDQPARKPVVGTGVVTGRVVNGGTKRPIADALVTLIGGDSTTVRVAQSDAAGAFILPGVAKGKFILGASKAPYLGSLYGASRPGRPGTPVVLTEGQILSGLEIHMWPGAIVTGVVTDDQGEPVQGVDVQLQQPAAGRGGSQLVQMLAVATSTSRSTTDDRGIYRLYGVAPGEYLVTANVPAALAQARRVAATEVADAARSVRETVQPVGGRRGAGPPTPPPAPARGGDTASLALGPSGMLLSYAPVYFPGTTELSRAATVTVALGEERTGINVRMEIVPLARVEGVVFGADGAHAANVTVTLQRKDDSSIMSLLQGRNSSRTAATGQFTIRNVAPGQYRVMARTGGPGRGATGPVFWAASDVTIEGQDLSGLVLQLQPGLSLMGRLKIDASRLAAPDLTSVSIMAIPMGNPRDQVGMLAGIVGGGGGQSARADGTFELGGLIPGPHLLQALQGDVSGNFSWRVGSVIIDGRETVDVPFEVKPGALPKEIVVTLTDAQQKLSGVISDSTGQPLTASTVLLISADRRYWYPDSRRVLAARPGTDGSYEFSGLLAPAAGDYFLSVVTDLDPNEQYDPSFLDALAKAAPVRIVLGPGETKRQDLKVR